MMELKLKNNDMIGYILTNGHEDHLFEGGTILINIRIGPEPEIDFGDSYLPVDFTNLLEAYRVQLIVGKNEMTLRGSDSDLLLFKLAWNPEWGKLYE